MSEFNCLFSPLHPVSKASLDTWDKSNNGAELESAEVERLISIKPSEIQLGLQRLEYYSFIHFGMNTFTGVEWGKGAETPKAFCPERIDTDQWARVLKNSGSRGIILTAKHHDGFCLFPSKYTEHSIKNSPYKNGKGDIVRELSDSCKKYGLLFGIYLSPWDRHEKTYGTPAYNDYFVNQLTELCENYGDIFCFWFDGAKGKDAPDFTYDFERYYNVIRTLQPKAAICNCGPDLRWIGNEGGKVRKSEWSVITQNTIAVEEVMKNSQQGAEEAAALQTFDRYESDLGSRELLSNHKNLIWSQGEADVSIHKDWFYSPKPRPRSARELEKIYFRTVGGNALLLLNVPPSKNGIIEPSDVKLLEEFKRRIDGAFKTELPFRAETQNGRVLFENEPLKKGDGAVFLKLSSSQKIRTIVLTEDTSQSQRIEKFDVYLKSKNGLVKVYSGTTIGSKKIIRLPAVLQKRTDEVVVSVTQSRSAPVFGKLSLFG